MKSTKNETAQLLVRKLRVALASWLLVSGSVLGILATREAIDASIVNKSSTTVRQEPNTFLANAGVTRNTVEPLSYQDSQDRFLIIGPDESPPAGFEQPDFAPVGFSVGNAAFGSGGQCSLQSTVQTNWPINTQLIIRRVVFIPAGATNVRATLSVDNDVIGVFFNGALLLPPSGLSYPIENARCPVLDQLRIDVPPELVQEGQNVIVYWLRDRGDESFFDTRILAELPQEDLSKMLHRIIGVAQRIPTPPITNVDVTCSAAGATPSQIQATITFNINATGHTGRLEITMQSVPRIEGMMTAFVGDTAIYTCNQTERVKGCHRLVDSTAINAQDVKAITAVMAQPVVQRQISNCVISNLPPPARPNATERSISDQQLNNVDFFCEADCRTAADEAFFQCGLSLDACNFGCINDDEVEVEGVRCSECAASYDQCTWQAARILEECLFGCSF